MCLLVPLWGVANDGLSEVVVLAYPKHHRRMAWLWEGGREEDWSTQVSIVCSSTDLLFFGFEYCEQRTLQMKVLK